MLDALTPGIGFALAAMLCFGASDLIYKSAAGAGIQARHFIMLQAWCFCPGMILYGLLTRTVVPHAGGLWGSMAGLFAFVAYYNFAQSLRSGAISTNAPIFRLAFIVTAMLAVLLLGETLTLRKSAGLACAVVAVWLLLGDAPTGSSGVQTAPAWSSLFRVTMATLAAGVANLLYKLGLGAGATPETLLVGQALVFISLSTLFVYAVDRRISPPWRGMVYAFPAAVLLLVAFGFLLHGLDRGPASVLVPVAQMGFIITALVGIAFLHEQLSARKLAGLALGALALGFLAIS